MSVNHALQDWKLLRKAVRERWPIPACRRGPLVRNLLERLADPDLDHRAFIAGFRALVEPDKVNQADLAQALAWLKGQLPEGQLEDEDPTREVIVRTREEAAALLSALPETGAVP